MTFDIKEIKKTEDGFEYNDCFFDTMKDVIQTGMLGFCGCGNPDDNLEYIYQGLLLIKKLQDEHTKPMSEFRCFLENWRKEKKEIFGNENSEQFFFYWADKEGLTEHGSCIPGWLTEKGKKFFDILEKYVKEHK